jgi:uncharacterized protein (DUF885 family)
MTSSRDLADRFHRRWLEENPFTATGYGIPGYDDLVPDESEAGDQAWGAEVEQFIREADAIAPGQLTPADAVTLDCTKEAATQELAIIDRARHSTLDLQNGGLEVIAAQSVYVVHVLRVRCAACSAGCMPCGPQVVPGNTAVR